MPETMIPVAKPFLDERDAEAATRTILSGWVTQGPEVFAFEREFASYTGAPYACAVSSCTAALHLALLAVGVQPGNEVITASHSFIATANSIRYCSAIPVFVDIAFGTFNLDPANIEAAISSKTRAILCVHQLGMPCDLRSILEIGRKHGLPVIEDAACAIGSEILWKNEWEKIGKPHADIACFSFHPRKLLTTGDGGMLTTANAHWDHRCRLWRQHGMSIPDTVRHRADRVVFESYEEVGFNYRMTDIQAAVGRQQLNRLDEIIQRRRYLAERYHYLLSAIPDLFPPRQPDWARTNWQSYCVRLPDRVDQTIVMQTMLNSGISTRRGVMCAHLEPPYRHNIWSCGGKTDESPSRKNSCNHLKLSEEARDRSVILPLYHQMTEADQDLVVNAFTAAIAVAV